MNKIDTATRVILIVSKPLYILISTFLYVMDCSISKKQNKFLNLSVDISAQWPIQLIHVLVVGSYPCSNVVQKVSKAVVIT